MNMEIMPMDREYISLVVMGFSQYKEKISYVDKWCDKITDIADNWYISFILEDVPEKSQIKLIFNDFTRPKEVIIEYDKTEEEVALQQIAAMVAGPQWIGIDPLDIYQHISPKVKFLTYAIEKKDDTEYLIAAKKWFKQIAQNYRTSAMLLISGDTGLSLAYKIARFYEEITGADKNILFQANGENWETANGIRISIWLNEEDH